MFHQRHGERVQSAVRIGRLATLCVIAALILLALGLWLIFR